MIMRQVFQVECWEKYSDGVSLVINNGNWQRKKGFNWHLFMIIKENVIKWR